MHATLSDKGRTELSRALATFLANFVPDMTKNQLFLLTSMIDSVISRKGMLQEPKCSPPLATGTTTTTKEDYPCSPKTCG